MDWGQLFDFFGKVIPAVSNLFNMAQGPIGVGMMGAGFEDVLEGIKLEQDAKMRKYYDERRLMDEANRGRHDVFMAKKALRDDEISRQEGLRKRSEELFGESLENQRSIPDDIEARVKESLAQYAKIPPPPMPRTQGATDAPKVVTDDLEKRMEEQRVKSGKRAGARAQVLAPGFALHGAGLGAGNISNAMQSVAGQSKRSGQVADIEQQLFNPVPLYPTTETGFDPNADIKKLVGSTLFNLGNQIRPSFSSMFDNMFSWNTPTNSNQASNPYGYNSLYIPAVDSRLGTRSGTGRYGSFPTYSNVSGVRSGSVTKY